MPQQSVQTQRDEKAQRRIDLGLPRLPDKLEGHEQHQRTRQRDLPAARTSQQIVDEQNRSDAGEKRGQQEPHPQRARQRHRCRHQPEIERWLLRVDVARDARHQPVTGGEHVARDEREPRLIRRPRIAQPEPRADQQTAKPDQPPEIEAHGGRVVSTGAQQSIEQRGSGGAVRHLVVLGDRDAR